LASKAEIARRREQVQKLLIRGLSASEIAMSVQPPVNERTIKRDIRWIRRINAEW
jgi:transposase